MTDSPLHLAKREWHGLISSPTPWVAMGAAGVILGFIGPFGTEDLMRLAPRVIYWTVVAICGYVTGAILGTVLVHALRPPLPLWLAAPASGLIAGVAIMVEITLLNWVVFGASPLDLNYMSSLLIDVLVISVIITIAAVFISREAEQSPATAALPPAPPRLLDRLPLDKRGALLALRVQDHYVEVTTDRGRALLLMRLSDAMAETGNVTGLQTHRSHWVALSAVASARRDGARAILTLTDGQEIPVARARVPAAKEAGLLPG